MRTRILTLVVLFTLCCGNAKADDAQQLARTLGWQKTFAAAVKDCYAQFEVLNADKMYEKYPPYFGGLTPESEQWPALLEAEKSYAQIVCSYLKPSTLENFAAQQYTTLLSADELQAAHAFFSSATGVKILQAQDAVTAEVSRIFVDENLLKLQEAMIIYSQIMGKLIELEFQDQIPANYKQ